MWRAMADWAGLRVLSALVSLCPRRLSYRSVTLTVCHRCRVDSGDWRHFCLRIMASPVTSLSR
ncbi:hypothetical protein PR003_g15525 [Phytophthora rubi]|uniref:Secreted protein n=1 Tax=Phytophthora rubi TaxID=129364 RepID=A0A6A4EZ51_9STRA|nr:hypothetical protein PR001_g16934 [Phytophthora rubi]KAE9011151.1 hypothetical protein PR002_g15164 [Phytophthora rubi]KAE9329544.1 hypothetical protein PR003_g15525 [Phytophthora rubi]